MLAMAGALADSCSGELQIVSCWNYEYEEFLRHNPWAPVPEDKIQPAVKSSQSDHLNALEKLIEQAGIADRSNNHVQQLRGSPDTLIPQFVENNDIDILVMGTLARTGIPGFTIGNTAENIVQKLSCSLLALKPHGFVSPVKAYE
jgi:nucleotide-binding universal stress UspA family protein